MDFIEILKVILLGIVEGITEWLPVSSTGHILLFDEIFSLHISSSADPLRAEAFKEFFKVIIQLGAILAVVVMFWKKIMPLTFKKTELVTGTDENGAPMYTVKRKLVGDKGVLRMWAKVLVACIPAVVLGFLLDDFLEKHLQTPLVIAITLIVYGAAFILIENYNKKRTFPIQTMSQFTYKHALYIGLFQVLSLIPGTSRSGATILGALLIGVSRPTASEFTFILAIPVMLGASALKFLKFVMEYGWFSGAELGYIFIAMAVAFAISLLAVKFLMSFVKKHSFKPFGWYRILLGAVVLGALVIPTFF